MKERLEGLLQQALRRASEGGGLKLNGLPPLLFEVPKDPKFGDLASTVALGLARDVRQPPRKIAETIREHIEDTEGILAEVSVEGPGYLNFRFSPRFWKECLLTGEREGWVRTEWGRGRSVLIEYVSANPTGPLHVGHGRGAVYGDVLARLLGAAGFAVTREYYVNDAGRQVATLGRSVLARLLQACGEDVAVPEDGYPGEYLIDLVATHRDVLLRDLGDMLGRGRLDPTGALAALRGHEEEAAALCGRRAAIWLLEIIRADLAGLRVEFDCFVSERELREAGVVESGLTDLEKRDFLFGRDDARWFRSSQFGDEKDRVVCRSDGELTYFASDIGYHRQKLERGYDWLIDVWGADHHGYIPRVRAAIEALSGDPDRLTVSLVQMVRITRGGEPVRMGKRKGEFITMREVVEEVGPDAARFFFVMRRADSHLDFDLELAKKQSADNPVFYVQYAHARICSVFVQSRSEGIEPPASGESVDFDRLGEPEEQEVMKLIGRVPDVIEDATRGLEPHRLVFHLIELAAAFHRFYNRHRILGGEPARVDARLYLCAAVRRVLATGLDLLGIEAPESM